MFEAEIARICDAIGARRKSDARFIVAIAGPPASGKSTLAEALVAHLGNRSVLVPMDGFHLDNRILKERGLLGCKGAPQTFDAEGFMALMERLRDRSREVVFPIFDRQRDIAIAGAGVVNAHHEVLVVEGNYLLIDWDPWKKAIPIYDLTIGFKTDLQTLEQRLIKRWLDQGLDQIAAERRARENDVANARLVLNLSLSPQLQL